MTSGTNITDTKTYLALGDSYTIGESVPEEERFPVQTVRLLADSGIAVSAPLIIARTGWRTDELDAAIREAGIRSTFDVVTLLIGVNDQYQGRSVEAYRPGFTQLLEQAVRFAGGDAGRVVVLSIPDWGVTPYADGRNREQIAIEIDAYNAANREIAASYKVHYLDITAGTRKAAEDNSLVAGDGLHPSGKEYAVWAGRLAPIMRDILR